ncbi:MAG: c-type cytochrome [Chloroflexota bacterium]
MKRIFYLLLVFSILILAACNNANTTSPVAEPSSTLVPVPSEYVGKVNPVEPATLTVGADLFNTNCSACHGPQGHGDGPAGAALDPAPKNLPELSKIAGDDYLFWRISTGRQGTAMVGWQGVLTEEQIWQIISFIHTLK